MPTKGVRLDPDRVAKERKALRLTQEEVARQLEIHENYYQRIEVGKASVSLELLALLETYFGVSANNLELVHPDDRGQFRR